MAVTLLRNGRIYAPADPRVTVPDATAPVTALAVTGDTITWLGSDTAARDRFPPGPDVHEIDLRGAFVAPAFVDAHVHATATGLLRTGVDLTGARSLAECLTALADQLRTHPTTDVVWGHGWDETGWPQARPPSRAELDAVAGPTPVYLSRIDVHSALISTALADRVPAARHAAGWSPDGPVSQQAHHHIRGAARAALSTGQRLAAHAAFLTAAAARGIACVHECAGPDISGATDLAELLASPGDHPLVLGYWGEITDPDDAARLGVIGLGGDLFIDGALGSRTAALTAPYTDEPATTGARYLDAAAIAEHVLACTRAGVQAGFHVIGDAAVAELVAGFARAETEVGAAALAACRHRAEHLEMVDAAQAARLAEWGVIASVQPAFDAAWGGPDGMYARRLGVARGTRLNPFATLAAAGVTLAFGSDSPVTPLDPWGTVRAATHHRTAGFGITPAAAFDAHTRGGWRAAGVGEPAGTLTAGAPATYAIWAVDTDVPAGGLPDLTPGVVAPVCLRTVRDGRIIYDEGSVG